MKTIKFACPHCDQHIQCGEEYGGIQIACPSCEGTMQVPEGPQSLECPSPLKPAPNSTSGGTSLHAKKTPIPRPSSHPTPAPFYSNATSRKIRGANDDTSPQGKKWLKPALTFAGIAVFIGILIVSWPVAQGWQTKMNEAREKDSGGGGQIGHIAELYAVLEATDPANQDAMFEEMDEGDDSFYQGGERQSRSLSAAYGLDSTLHNLPLSPPQIFPSLASVEIPNSRVNGTVFNQGFECDYSVLITGGPLPVLAFRQGDRYSPTRELLVFLKPRAGGLQGQLWEADYKPAKEAPQIMMRWRNDDSAPWQQKDLPGAYRLRLELGEAQEDILPGKLYLSSPGNPLCLVGGLFEAEILRTAPKGD